MLKYKLKFNSFQSAISRKILYSYHQLADCKITCIKNLVFVKSLNKFNLCNLLFEIYFF